MRGYEDSKRKDGQREEPERAMRLMEALSDVDQALLERCAGTGRGVHFWHGARAVAAVLCLAVVGAASWGGYQLSRTRMGGADSSGGAAAPYMEEIREDEEEAVPRDEVNCDTAPEAAGAEDAVEAGQGGEQIRQTEADKFMDGQYADGGEMPPGQEAAIEEGKRDGSGTGGDAVKENGSPEDTAGCPLPPQSQKLTLAQAREDAALGAYVPTALPAGYAFEEAHRVTEATEANLSLRWSRGMASIMLHLEKTGTPPATVDVEKPETYDERLYEVPYGETVPKEYRQTFDNPVFAAEDFSLEIVESRMKSYDDRGDTDTPRGNFSVLYGDGVLISFNGRGTAEEIWEMFCSMGGE